ncbi:general secretion pathway protein E [Tanticharoenia sakaeratensis NBRC 103193]|nr:general secretion pathway protein E [Tanticharoenia sakaeratensis NBRC 103193]
MPGRVRPGILRCCDLGCSGPAVHPELWNGARAGRWREARRADTIVGIMDARAPFLDAFEPEALDQILLARGDCDARTLARARRVAEETGNTLPRVLAQLGLVGERALADAYAALLHAPLARPEDYAAIDEPVWPERLNARFLRHARALPLRLSDNTLWLAMADPLDRFVHQSVRLATGADVSPVVAVPIELDAALARLYPEIEPGAEPDADGAGEAGHEADADRLRDLASEAPVIRLVNQLIARAVETRASDIHVEPFEDALRVRYRYDGVLHEGAEHPARLAPAIVSRIKIMARLDIAERRLPQDGRIQLAVRGQDVDFRVSTVPSLHGETVVLRVLDRSATRFDYATLGLSPDIITQFRESLSLANGIVLVTGPTGSGKTTTLYTGLSGLNTTNLKVITIEDPVEYQLAGIAQMQVKPQIGLDFAHCLRAILRQDPDVIMVGEIRDLETAQIAVQAALTGHLVLSTLHTNSAAATIARLRDMGLEDYLIATVLRGVLAQRLVRRLCHECRQPEPDAPALIEAFGLKPGPGQGLWRACGCPACRGTGYAGRLAVAEFLKPSAGIAHLISTHADGAVIAQAAEAEGMVPMLRAGLAAALDGETTTAEVLRVLRSDG